MRIYFAKMRYILRNSDKCEIFFKIQILCEYVNYSTKMQILRENTNILRNAGTMQILRGITTQKYYTEIQVANIQANRLLRVYRAELLVRLDQFSYTHS